MQKGFVSPLILLLVIVIVAALGYFLFAKNFYQANEYTDQSPYQNKLENLLPKPSPSVYIEKKWYLKRKDGDKTETLYSFIEHGEFRLIRWQDLLFMGGVGYEPQLELKMHNIKTGETKAILSEEANGTYIADLKIFGDILYFTSGGYLAKGATYALDLPPAGDPKKIAEGRNQTIQKMGDRYWLIGGEGDSCWGISEFATIDILTKKITPIASTNYQCGEGTTSLNIDYKDRLLIASTHGKEEERYDHPLGYLDKIEAITISNPSSRETILSGEKIPKDITGYILTDDKKSIFLYGYESGIYLFNLENNSLEKIGDLPKELSSAYLYNLKGNDVCLKNSRNSDYVTINLQTKKINLNSGNCLRSEEVNQSIDQRTEKKIETLKKDLNLPPNYTLTLE